MGTINTKCSISACIGDFTGDSGYIYPPARSLNLVSYHCEWERSSETATNKTIAFTLLNGTIGTSDYQQCYHHWNAVFFSTGECDETGDFLAVIYSAGRLMEWDEVKSSWSPRFENSVLGPLSVVVISLLSFVQTSSHEGYNFD